MVQRLWATWIFDPAGGFEAAPFYQADGGIDDRLGGQSMGRTAIKAEHIAGQMECTDLAPSVAKKLVGPNRAVDHLIDVFAGLSLAINFLILPVGKFGRDHA